MARRPTTDGRSLSIAERVKLDAAYDPAAVFETLFAANGWTGSWRDSMYVWLHYHSNTHEVLGIARGWLHARFERCTKAG